ncbi:DUF1853 family protein [Joostella atrarenae]|nr:DUF1853 family protein [Joostella atrarenae]
MKSKYCILAVMDIKSKHIQQQYEGYLQTPALWENVPVFGLHQFKTPKQAITVFNRETPKNLRLGKLVEFFVSSELSQNNDIKTLLENYQVQNGKHTIGEIDCILLHENKPIHLEVVYKFYLYDENVGTTEIEHWIGPNRNDTLIKKLSKLKEKQLPLLYNEYTEPILDKLHLKSEEISQAVLFKAQLFTPYKETIGFENLNKDCLKGFYVNVSDINQFHDCKFYIPSKKNWLSEVHLQVDWMVYKQFSEQINILTEQKMSPLCWIKFPNGLTKKFFVVWW